MNKNIFVIHGHDSVVLLELKEFLRKLGLNPVVLQDQPNRNMTVIEKFEKFASSSVFAIAILTPDDLQAEKLGPIDKYRARQNVILEAGWFMGKLGRQKVLLLHKGKVELPSDIFGVLYIPFSKTIIEASEQLRDELTAQGLI